MALLLTQVGNFQIRPPLYATRVTVTWNNFWAQNLLQSTLTPVTVQLPPGEQLFDLPPRGPEPLNKSYILSINLNLLPPPPVDTTHQPRSPLFTPPKAPLRLDYDILPNLTVRLVTPQKPTVQTDWPINLGPV